MAKALDLQITDVSDLLAIAQYHVNSFDGNRSRLNTLIRTEMGRTPPTTPTLQVLARLDVKTIWTTNYDGLIESALIEAGKRPQVIWSEDQIHSRDQSANVMIYKMHGDAKAPESAVLTKSDYEKYHLEHQHFLSFLGVELSQRTFIFIGFGFRDYNIDYVFGRLRSLFKEDQRPHYCILKRPDRDATESDDSYAEQLRLHKYFMRDLSRRGVDVIEIDSYDELTHFLVKLNARSVATGLKPGMEKTMDAIAREIHGDDRTPSESMTAGNCEDTLVTALLAPIAGMVYLNVPQQDMEHTSALTVPGLRIETGNTLFFLASPFSRTKVVSPIEGEITEVVVTNYAEVQKEQTLCLVLQTRAPEDSALYVQYSDLDGRFYRAPDPHDEPFVRVGDRVRRGDIVCLVEIAKTFHGIGADVNGIIRMINIENASDVTKGTYLFGIETSRKEMHVAHERFARLPFVVQRSPARGRFFGLKIDGHSGPFKMKGEVTLVGDPVARVKMLGKEVLILADSGGRFLEYLKRDGDSVDLGEPIIKIIPEAAVRATRRSFLVQTADRAGTFKTNVKLHAAVHAGQVIGTIGDAKIVCKHNGMISEISPKESVEPNDVIFKFAH